MNAAEIEARQLLRWFPSAWRRSHGEALVGTLLDAADADGRNALTDAERRDLMVSGIGERAAALVPDAVRRLAAPIALGIGASFAGLQLLTVEWAPWTPSSAWQDLSPIPYEFGPFTSAGAVIDLLWLAALVLGLLGLRRAMVATLGASVVASLVLYFAPITSWSVGRPASTAMTVMALLAVVASSAALTARSFRPTAIVAAVLSAGALVGGMWGNFPTGGWFASSFLIRNLNAAPVGAVILLAVVIASLAGRHRIAQAVLFAVGPAWVVLLARSLTADVLWLAVVAVAILTVALVASSMRYGWRIRVDWNDRPTN